MKNRFSFYCTLIYCFPCIRGAVCASPSRETARGMLLPITLQGIRCTSDTAHDDTVIAPGEQIGDDVFDDAAGDGIFGLVEEDGLLRASGDVFQPAQRMQEHVAHTLDGDGLALE